MSDRDSLERAARSVSFDIPERPATNNNCNTGSSDASTPRYSSPDVLTGNRSPSPPRATYALRPLAKKRPTANDYLNERSPSPDELDHTFYADEDATSDRSPRRSNTPSSTHSSTSSDDSDTERSPSPPPHPLLKTINYTLQKVLDAHAGGVAKVKFSPDGRWIASASADSAIIVWDVMTGQIMRTLTGHIGGVSALAWSPDSEIIASGGDDKMVWLWDRVTGETHSPPLQGHHSYISSIAFSPKGNIMATGSYDEAIFFWDLRAGQQMRSLPAHSDPVLGLDWIFDGTMLASCSSDGLIRIWDGPTGQCLQTLIHDDNIAVVGVKFSPNGKHVMAWTLDSSLRLWEYVDGLCKKTYQGHQNQKFGICGAFGSNGLDTFVMSGSEDGSILLWDVNSKNIIQDFDAHEGSTLCVDAHPFLDMIVSGGEDGMVKLWLNDDDGEDYAEDETIIKEDLKLEGDYKEEIKVDGDEIKGETEVEVKVKVEVDDQHHNQDSKSSASDEADDEAR